MPKYAQPGLQLGRRLADVVVLTDRTTGKVLARIKVQRIERGKVRLGIDADQRYRISREDATEEDRSELQWFNELRDAERAERAERAAILRTEGGE